MLAYQIVPPQHVVDITGDVERVHRFFTALVRDCVDLFHDRGYPFSERRTWWVRVEFIILDEIQSRLRQIAYQWPQLLDGQADTGFGNGANQRPAFDRR